MLKMERFAPLLRLTRTVFVYAPLAKPPAYFNRVLRLSVFFIS